MTSSHSPTVQFLGATGTVTGSKFLLEADGYRVLIDAGLFQGLKELRERNWAPLPVEPHSIDAVVLTHAHIDHTGYLPRLLRDGFRGNVLATPATRDLSRIMLPDAARIQEEDAAYANRKGFSKHHPALPLYTEEEANAALRRFRTLDYGEPYRLHPGVTFSFTDVGHILGAATAQFQVEAGGRSVSVLFSGDVGRYNQPVTKDPPSGMAADYLVLESTYGNRSHGEVDVKAKLSEVVNRTAKRGGHLVIPAFALGRTQHLLYLLRELENEQRIPILPVFVDSPMAQDTTELYLRYASELDAATADLTRGGQEPFRTRNMAFASSVGESKRATAMDTPTIVVSASGMATGGRVLHHLERRLPDPRSTILFVGFQAAGTRGRRLVNGETELKMHGVMVPVRAEIEQLEGLSAHANADELVRWLRSFQRAPRHTYLVHGEPDAAEALRERLVRELGWEVSVPRYQDTLDLV